MTSGYDRGRVQRDCRHVRWVVIPRKKCFKQFKPSSISDLRSKAGMECKQRPTSADRASRGEPLILRLPYEVLAIIFRMAFTSFEGEQDRQTLGALTRTCREFRHVAQPILFWQLDITWSLQQMNIMDLQSSIYPVHLILSLVQHSMGDLVRVADLWAGTHAMAASWNVCLDYLACSRDIIEAYDPDWDFSNWSSIPFGLLVEKLGVGMVSPYFPPIEPVTHSTELVSSLSLSREDSSVEANEIEQNAQGYLEHTGDLYDDDDQGEYEDQEQYNDWEEYEEWRNNDYDTSDPLFNYGWKRSFSSRYLFIAMALAALPNLVKVRLPIDSDSLRLLRVPTSSDRFPVLLSTKGAFVTFYPQHFPSLSRLQELELAPSLARHCLYDEAPNVGFLFADHLSWIVQRSPNFRTLRLSGFVGLGGRIENFRLPCHNITTLCLIGCSIPIQELRVLLAYCPQLVLFKMTKTNKARVDTIAAARASSVVLDMLSEVAPQIQKVFLGVCLDDDNDDVAGIPDEGEPVLPTAGLNCLKTLGLRVENIYQHSKNVLANLVKDCPSLESLQIFGAVQTSDFTSNQELTDWLQALSRELSSNSKAQLREIKLSYVDRDHWLRRVDDSEYLTATGQIEPGERSWYQTMRQHQWPRTHESRPFLGLEEWAVVEIYRSLGVHLHLEMEEGYMKPDDYEESSWTPDCLLPPIGDINSDEALWEGTWTQDGSVILTEASVPGLARGLFAFNNFFMGPFYLMYCNNHEESAAYILVVQIG
ncbi:hypothetical protein V8F20_008564 [Naviculisporaceae sp. PSN 640]